MTRLNRSKIAQRVLGASIALALALAVNVAPAAAHNNYCGTGYFCVWPQTYYTDSLIPQHEHFSTSSSDWPLFGIENDDDSAKNMESYRVRVFADSGYNNVEYCMTPGEVEDDISDDLDNDGDGHKVDTTTSCGTLPRP